MKKLLCFDDVLIEPQFSFVPDRTEASISLNSTCAGTTYSLPLVSANMACVTEHRMADAMSAAGGVGCLHRFMSIADNATEMVLSPHFTWGSVGISEKEFERAKALVDAGCETIVVDVAHAAQIGVVNFVKRLKHSLKGNVAIIVGNFATARTIKDFNYHLGDSVDAYKVGIGGGSACTTRVVTGVGVPTLTSVLDCVPLGVDIIADGGFRTHGDVAKALATGAKMVMVGRMVAGTYETPGETVTADGKPCSQQSFGTIKGVFKRYSGSASQESYEAQGKVAAHRTAEGESFLVPYMGPVASILQSLAAGLRSSYSYVGAVNTEEFFERATLNEISEAAAKLNGAHGKMQG